jgi:hypothetical protein
MRAARWGRGGKDPDKWPKRVGLIVATMLAVFCAVILVPIPGHSTLRMDIHEFGDILGISIGCEILDVYHESIYTVSVHASGDAEWEVSMVPETTGASVLWEYNQTNVSSNVLLVATSYVVCWQGNATVMDEMNITLSWNYDKNLVGWEGADFSP